MASVSTSRRWALAIVAVVFLALIYAARSALTPVFLAFAVAYLVDPVADKLEKHMTRTGAVIVIFTAVLLPATLGTLLLIPKLLSEFMDLARQLTHAADHGRVWLESQGVSLPHTGTEWLQALRNNEALSQQGNHAAALINHLFAGTMGLFGAIASMAMVPIFIFYFLRDYDPMVAWVNAELPGRYAASIRIFCSQVDDVLSGFARGQLMVMTTLAILYSAGLLIVGVKLGLAIGIIAGVVSIVPYLGAVIGLGLAIIMALISSAAWPMYAGIAVVFLIGNVLEGFVITPKIMGDKLGLAPAAILVAMLFFGELLGFFGVLIAIPLAAVTKIVLQRSLELYRTSSLYQAPSPDTPA